MSSPEGSAELDAHLLDARDAATSENVGIIFGSNTRLALEERGIELPHDARLLALGAGQAQPELALADTLGITQDRVTLLDKKFSPTAVNKFSTMGFQGQLVQRDFFEFLEQPEGDRFDVVTAFGLEYVYDTSEKMERFINGLSRRVRPNGVVVVNAVDITEDLTPVWNRNGFTSLAPAQGRVPLNYHMLYSNPIPR